MVRILIGASSDVGLACLDWLSRHNNVVHLLARSRPQIKLTGCSGQNLANEDDLMRITIVIATESRSSAL